MFDYISMHGVLAYGLFLLAMLQLHVAKNIAPLSNRLEGAIIAVAMFNLVIFTLIQLDIAESLYAAELQHAYSSAN